MKVTDFDAGLREIYGRDGQPTERGRQMLAELDAARVERNKAIAALIDERGRPTDAGVSRLFALSDVLQAARMDHTDNCGGQCRVDLDGHDCCSVCNQAEDMLRATAAYYEEPA